MSVFFVSIFCNIDVQRQMLLIHIFIKTKKRQQYHTIKLTVKIKYLTILLITNKIQNYLYTFGDY